MERKSRPARVAVVTGASRGIGAATAIRLSRDGWHVVLSGRSHERLSAVAGSIRSAGGTADVVTVDLADPLEALDMMADLAHRFDYLDVLVNNAGVLPPAKRTERITVQEWEETFRVNLTSPWALSCRFAELAKASRPSDAVIVNITSTAASYPSIGLSSYNASKCALTMLTKALAIEWAAYGVRVVGIAPGKVRTDLAEGVFEYFAERELELNPLGRAGTVEEIAGAVAYVCGSEARFITGSVLTIDGGEVAGMSSTKI